MESTEIGLEVFVETDLISYLGFLVARDSARWGFLSMLANWGAVIIGVLSFIVSVVTLCIARKAMNTWREQEQTKAKQEFKKSLLALRNILIYMPAKWTQADLNLGEKVQYAPDYHKYFHKEVLDLPVKLKMLIDANNHSNDCWVICEHLFDGSQIEAKWKLVQDAVNEYIQKGKDRDEVFHALNSLYSERFVFEFK